MRIRFSLFFLTMVLLLSAACGKEQDSLFISGSQKRSQKSPDMMTCSGHTIYYTPLMEKALVRENVPYSGKLMMDLYYPPNFDGIGSLPVVVIANSLCCIDMKNSGRFVDWALIFTTQGMAAVNFNCDYAEKDLIFLLTHLQEHSEDYNIDPSKIVLFCFSGYCEESMRVLMNTDQPFPENIALAVYLFPLIPKNSDIPKDVPMIIVRIGKNPHAEWNDCLDDFVRRAMALGTPLTLIDYREGNYNFDYFDTGESWITYSQNPGKQRDIQVIADVLERIKNFF